MAEIWDHYQRSQYGLLAKRLPVLIDECLRTERHATGDDLRRASVLTSPTPQLLSVYGSLHLMCALSASRDDDRGAAKDHLDEAAKAAEQLGSDANYVWTAFGPTNVAIHQVCVALEFGDVQRAIKIGPGLDTSRLPVERRVRHGIELARAFVRFNQPDSAIGELLNAEVIAPDQVRYHRLSRMLVREILSRSKAPRPAIDLAVRMGLQAPRPFDQAHTSRLV